MKMVYAEWQKIWFVKSFRIYLVFAVIISILTGLIFSLTTKITQGRQLSELSPMEIISVNMLGVDVWTLFIIIFISVRIGCEFQEKTIQSYLTVTPSRSHYFLAKMAIFFLIALAIGILVALVTCINGQILISVTHKQMPSSPMLWQFSTGCLVMPIFYSLLTVCAVFFTRNTAGGIVMPALVLFFPVLIKLFPEILQSVFIPLLPASAIHTLSGAAEKGSGEYIGMIAPLPVLSLWLLVFAIAAFMRFEKKDI